jgi:hypothetical protein
MLKLYSGKSQWLTSVILATQEEEIKRSGGLRFEASPGQIVLETLSRNNPSHKRAGGVAQTPVPHTHIHTQKKMYSKNFF